MILHRADAVYEIGAWGARGQNNAGGHMTGSELLAAYRRGERFFVGRSRGINGPFFLEDLNSGRWRTLRYETNREADSCPNSNWFSLADFANCVNMAVS